MRFIRRAAAGTSVLAVLYEAAGTYFHLPATLHASMTLSRALGYLVVIYVAVMLILMIFATATVHNAELHSRFKKLMLTWAYSLMAPWMIFKTFTLPDREDESHEPTALPDVTEVARLAQELGTVQAALEDERARSERFRIGLQMTSAHLRSVIIDRDVQALVMEELAALEQRYDQS